MILNTDYDHTDVSSAMDDDPEDRDDEPEDGGSDSRDSLPMISASESEPYMSSASKDSVSDESSSTGSENRLGGSQKRWKCEAEVWICDMECGLMECDGCVSESLRF